MNPSARIAELEAQVERLQREQEELDDELRILMRAERRFYQVERNIEVQMSRMKRLNSYFIKSTRFTNMDEVLLASAVLLGELFGLPVSAALRFNTCGEARGVAVVDEEASWHDGQLSPQELAGVRTCELREAVMLEQTTEEVDRVIAVAQAVIPPNRYGELAGGREHIVLVLRDAHQEPVAVIFGVRPRSAPGSNGLFRPTEEDTPFLQIVQSSMEASFEAILMQDQLKSAARELEDRVQARTAELTHVNGRLAENIDALKAMQSELIEASRLAGMSEVATGVLHNVGNVLNSVNVSASLVGERVSTLLDGRLEALATLLERAVVEPSAMPPTDRLAQYARKLATRLDDEKRTLTAEAEQLTHNVSHIRTIVSTQQSYAKAAGVTEVCSISELINDALTLNRESLEKGGIEVSVDVPVLPLLRIDRHKILQILVNLLSNAIQAVHAGPKKSLGVRVKATERDGKTIIAVEDDGCGIAEANLARVFAQGFTTRADGHGFGLHASACAARELGGELVAMSDGPGCGARFELVLPLEHLKAA